MLGFAGSAFADNGVVKAGPEGVGKLVNMIIPIDLNGFLNGVQNHVAFMAPMQIFIEFNLKVFGYLSVKVIGKFL